MRDEEGNCGNNHCDASGITPDVERRALGKATPQLITSICRSASQRDGEEIVKRYDRKLVLEDGKEFYGYGFGADVERVCEVVFNTSPVGYQEIASDPSYTDQFVTMTYPLIGNYGITDDDFECVNPSIGGMIVGDYNDSPSNFRSV